ncbi:btb poz protein [Teratosphaeria destructans]|uniref:Btb poz protein n=1 Tax=Teratosphaeria destructans TaxID=418781 RepID=A0A9W7SS19_9PEZI|nr:btb poz protein [Teratosphaeria destructans]
MRREAIDPEGDIILLLVDTESEIRELQVSSLILKAASSRLRDVINRRDSTIAPPDNDVDAISSVRAKRRMSNVPVVGEEDATGFRLLCLILHYRFTKIERTATTVPDMLKMAITADKYCCVPAVRYFVQVWFSNLKPEAMLANTSESLALLSFLNDGRNFAEFTKMLIQDFGTYELPEKDRAPQLEELQSIIDTKRSSLYGALQFEVDRTVKELAMALLRPSTSHKVREPYTVHGSPVRHRPSHSTNNVCAYSRHVWSSYIQMLVDADLWPAVQTEQPLVKAVASIQVLRMPVVSAAVPQCGNCPLDTASGDLTLSEKAVAEAILAMKAWAEKAVEGVCLKCYKEGGMYMPICRFASHKT